jgi:2-dehydro-3-deoxyphosphooctonate aldolase (KDO 8-P synthase)
VSTGREAILELGPYLIGNSRQLALIAGPCMIEGEEMALECATTLKRVTDRLGIPYVFKASFDKANRTSVHSRRGPGLEGGLRVLEKIRSEVGVLVLTDVHEDTPVDEVAQVVDVLQTPAMLVRQTNFIQRVARAGKPVNLKKGQFLAPWDMHNVVEKCREVGNDRVMVCERGVCFGYNALIADMRSLALMRDTGCPVVFDATHSTQQPGARGTASGGEREMIPVLARAGVAAGIAALYMETHPDPDRAYSDGPNQWPLERMEELLALLVEIDRAVKKVPYAENQVWRR